MAKMTGRVPENFGKKEGEDYDRWIERASDLMKDYEDASDRIDPGGGSLKDAIVRFPVADGHAVYVVSKDDPLELKHVPYGAAYEAAPSTIRGLTRTEVRDQLRRAAFFRGMRLLNDSFYAFLKPGQIVHYHNGLGAFVRCEVVAGKDGNCLKPVALVGPWPESDLPRRLPSGEVLMGFHAERIKTGETMRPNEGTIWESPRCLLPKMKNPADLSPISLDVPEMTPEQEQQAALWRKISEIRALIDGDGSAPFILSEISRIAAPGDDHSCRRDGCAGPVCDRDVPNLTRDDG